MTSTPDPQVGFGDPRVLTAEPIAIHDAELEEVLGGARFYSVTYRCGAGLTWR